MSRRIKHRKNNLRRRNLQRVKREMIKKLNEEKRIQKMQEILEREKDRVKKISEKQKQEKERKKVEKERQLVLNMFTKNSVGTNKNIVQVGYPKCYIRFRKQAICIFTYQGWKITIHPNILTHFTSQKKTKINNICGQILFEGYGFCFTLLDRYNLSEKNSSGIYTELLFSRDRDFDNWKGPYLGKNKFITNYQCEGFKKLRNVLKSFCSFTDFVYILKNELKYLNHVPHNIGPGISVGSKTSCSQNVNQYNVFNKKWQLYKYGLDEPIIDFDIFYKKLLPKIGILNSLWRNGRSGNKNDPNKYELFKKNQLEDFISKFLIKRKQLVRKYFFAFKRYVINIKNLKIDDNLISIKEEIIETLEKNETSNEIDINKDLFLIFENNNQVFLQNNVKLNNEFKINKKIEVNELVSMLDSKSKKKESDKNENKSKDLINVNINQIDVNMSIQNTNTNVIELDKSIENPNVNKIIDITNSLECLIIHLKNLN